MNDQAFANFIQKYEKTNIAVNVAAYGIVRTSQQETGHCKLVLVTKNKRIYDGVEAETRKSQASFQIIQVSSEALPRMRLE